MLLVVADLLTGGALVPGGTRWWHGIGIGFAAGVKLTPLIFIPYLLLIRRYRQAATAAGCSRPRWRSATRSCRVTPAPTGRTGCS